jgi:hypothetical protein
MGSAESRTLKTKSLKALTVLCRAAALLPGSGSSVALLTIAVLFSVPRFAAFTSVTRVTVTFSLLFMLPGLQAMTLCPLQLPCVDTAETRFKLRGSVSVSSAPLASEGPLLAMTSV